MAVFMPPRRLANPISTSISGTFAASVVIASACWRAILIPLAAASERNPCFRLNSDYGNAKVGSCGFSGIVGLHCANECLGLFTGRHWFPSDADVKAVVYTNPGECQQACQATAGCDVFTFDQGLPQTGMPATGPSCWLKASVDCDPAYVPKNGLVSGPAICPNPVEDSAVKPPVLSVIGPAVPEPCFKNDKLYGNIDRGSCGTSQLVGLHCSRECVAGMGFTATGGTGGVQIAEVQYVTAKECQRACQELLPCQFFSYNYNTPDTVNEFSKACWLKAAVDCEPGYVDAKGFTSGPRFCNTAETKAFESDLQVPNQPNVATQVAHVLTDPLDVAANDKPNTTSVLAASSADASHPRGRDGQLLPSRAKLLPVDNGHGPVDHTKRDSRLIYIHSLAGPWGLPAVVDESYSLKSLWAPAWKGAMRHHVHRAVIVFALSRPHVAWQAMRTAMDAHKAHDVLVLTPGFPTFSQRRGLPKKAPPCSAIWHSNHQFLSNRPLRQNRKKHCQHSFGPLPTPCEMLLGLVDKLRAPRFPNLKHLKVLGFSAGAQMLDRCMYSNRLITEPLIGGVPDVQFIVASPSTLVYPVPERAMYSAWATTTCTDFEPLQVLQRTYKFEVPDPGFMASMAQVEEPDWKCHHWTHWDRHLLWKHSRSGKTPLWYQKHVCTRRTGKMFEYAYTKGNNQHNPGCGNCFCCKRPRTSTISTGKCENYNHYRYGVDGNVPPDMAPHHKDIPDDVIRRAILNHNVIYVGSSADVCNWRVQSNIFPKCGFCKQTRGQYSQVGQGWAYDIHSPIVHTCGALWQGKTRLERMKVYRDAMIHVVAPRFGISLDKMRKRRQFLTLIGVGHDLHDVVRGLAKCIALDACKETDKLVAMEDFLPEDTDQINTVVEVESSHGILMFSEFNWSHWCLVGIFFVAAFLSIVAVVFRLGSIRFRYARSMETTLQPSDADTEEEIFQW